YELQRRYLRRQENLRRDREPRVGIRVDRTRSNGPEVILDACEGPMEGVPLRKVPREHVIRTIASCNPIEPPRIDYTWARKRQELGRPESARDKAIPVARHEPGNPWSCGTGLH